MVGFERTKVSTGSERAFPGMVCARTSWLAHLYERIPRVRAPVFVEQRRRVLDPRPSRYGVVGFRVYMPRRTILKIISGASRPEFRRMRGIRASDELLFGSGGLTVLKWQVRAGLGTRCLHDS